MFVQRPLTTNLLFIQIILADCFYLHQLAIQGNFDPSQLKWSNLKCVLWHQEESENSKEEAHACGLPPSGDLAVMLVHEGVEALGFGGPDRRLVFSGLEALGFGGPDRRLVFSGLEALGFGGPDRRLVFSGL